ncbi:3172_t:CDS:2 [Gigaspora rosea]|nr:3172_t:CDS:2 [Gigaspora rosea]
MIPSVKQDNTVTSSLNHQIPGPIQQNRIRTARKFTLFDASKPFISPLKSRNNGSSNIKVIDNESQRFLSFQSHDNDSSDIRVIDEETQQILPSISSNSIDNLPRVIIENCNNCKVEINITLRK